MLKRMFPVASLVAIAALSGATLAYAQSPSVAGHWQLVRTDNQEVSNFTLTQSGQTVTGAWAPPKGPAVKIKDGTLNGDTLTCWFFHDKKRFNVTGHITGDSMTLDVTSPEKDGKKTEIHANATRTGSSS